MEFTIKKLPKSEVELTITIDNESVEKHRTKALDELSKEINVKGFRKGHVPAKVVEQNVDPRVIDLRAQELAIQEAYAEIVVKEKIEVISRPEVEILSYSPLSFKAKVAILPEVKIKDLKSIKVPEIKTDVTEDDIGDVINDFKRYGTTWSDVDREAKMGDRVEVDFEGFDLEGKPVENTASKNHPLILGSKTMIPGFEEEVLGLKKGDEKEFVIKFPEDYHKKDMAGVEFKFKIKANRIEEPTEPNLDEDYIEKMTGKKQTLDELKAEIKKNILAQKEQKAKTERESKYIEELVKRVEIELPEALIHEEVHYIFHEVKDEIAGKGVDFDKFLESAHSSEDELHKKYWPEAERRLKIRMGLRKALNEEGISVSDEEIVSEFEKVKSFYPEKEVKKITDDFENGELKGQIANRLALRKFFDKVLA